MIYYYFIFIFSLISGIILLKSQQSKLNIISTMSKNQRKKFYLFLVFFLIFIIVGFRDITVGADTRAYDNFYFKAVANNGIFLGNSEIVFNIIAWISLLFSSDYQVFLILNSAIISFLFAKFIYDNSENVLLSTVIFLGMFFVQSMNLMRSWLALAIGINGYTFYVRGKKKSALLLFLISTLTHNTAIVFFVIPIIRFFRNKNINIMYFVFASVFIYIFRVSLLTNIINIIPRYNDYIFHSYFISEENLNIKDIIFVSIEIFMFFIIIFKSKFTSRFDIQEFISYSIIMLFAITLSFLGQNFGILHRLVYYFSVFLIIALPKFISKTRLKSAIQIILIISMFFMLFRNSYFDNNLISNYDFFFD